MKTFNKLNSDTFWKKFLHDSQHSLQTTQLNYAPGELDEQAFPTYLSSNPFVRWLFWERLRTCLDEISATNGTTCLDFGCGSGVMLPVLGQEFEKVIGVDLMPELARQHLEQMKKRGWPTRGDVNIVSSLKSVCPPDNYFDLILALDVFEHVENLDELLSLFASKLNPSGTLLVSGPSENIVYRVGRKVLGYSGHYHIRNIYEIWAHMKQHFNVTLIRQLVFPLTLFLILRALKNKK